MGGTRQLYPSNDVFFELQCQQEPRSRGKHTGLASNHEGSIFDNLGSFV